MEFQQQCIDRMIVVQTLIEAEFHLKCDPPPLSPHSQALMNLKGTKKKATTFELSAHFDEDTKGEKKEKKVFGQF